MADHKPVLTQPVLQLLAPSPGESYLDLTAGYGGHASLIASKLDGGEMVLVDQDEQAVSALQAKFADRTQILHMDFEAAVNELGARGRQFDMILLDLGMSSPQLEDPARGFSFAHNGPLDMRMDRRQQTTAAEIVNHTKEKDLADLIYAYGEERKSRQIARAIVANRPLQSTSELADIVAKVVRRRGQVPSGTWRRRIHPATRTFQALRIAVNDELGRLERTLPRLVSIMKPGSRLAVISFHSGEDRIAKRFIQANSRSEQAVFVNLTTKVIDGRTQDPRNPRARSAKLRAVRKAG